MGSDQAVDFFGLVGSVLDGKYRVDEVVAGGGFGVVYRGHHLRLDVPLAIKVLKPNRLLSREARDETVTRFLMEAQTTARLRHPGIAQVLDTGLVHTDELPEGVPWMVLEWLEGETLESALDARRGQGGRSPSEALALLAPVLEAVAFAHEAGVVHRDLKPANIMLARQGGRISARVLDFGIAKLMEGPASEPSGHTYTDAAFVAFSPGYAAPEQVSRSRTGFWTDVHALALMLTEVLTDAPPYHAADQTALLGAVVSVERPTPARHGVDVGPWEDVLARALALSPRDRFDRVGDLLEALKQTVAQADALYVARTSPREAPAPVQVISGSAARGITPAAYGDDSTVPASSTLPPPPARAKRPGLYLGLAVVALVGVVAAGLAVGRPAPPTPSSASAAFETQSAHLPTSASIEVVPSAPVPRDDPAPEAGPVPAPVKSSEPRPPPVTKRPPPAPKSAEPKPPPAPTRVTPTTSFE